MFSSQQHEFINWFVYYEPYIHLSISPSSSNVVCWLPTHHLARVATWSGACVLPTGGTQEARDDPLMMHHKPRPHLYDSCNTLSNTRVEALRDVCDVTEIERVGFCSQLL